MISVRSNFLSHEIRLCYILTGFHQKYWDPNHHNYFFYIAYNCPGESYWIRKNLWLHTSLKKIFSVSFHVSINSSQFSLCWVSPLLMHYKTNWRRRYFKLGNSLDMIIRILLYLMFTIFRINHGTIISFRYYLYLFVWTCIFEISVPQKMFKTYD